MEANNKEQKLMNQKKFSREDQQNRKVVIEKY